MSATLRGLYPGRGGERSAYRFVPLDQLTKPRNGSLDCYLDRYWVVTDEGALLFRGVSPQCNVNRTVTERLKPEWARVEFIPVAFLTHECEQ